jgi:peptidyl-prolyl cis-trans isomerase C
MIRLNAQIFSVMSVLVLASCEEKKEVRAVTPSAPESDAVLLSVGDYAVRQSDLDLYVKDHHDGRKDASTQKIALEALAERAQLAQAATEDGLREDPVVRAEIARVLATRYKEKHLNQQIAEVGIRDIPEAELREIYERHAEQYRSPEKRQVAVLWLNHNGNPEREQAYVTKLNAAREWLMSHAEVKDHPELGFSVLSVDHSEHAASRFKGGVLGWLQAEGGFDAFSKAVAAMAFSLQTPGQVSDVIVAKEGVFLVRLMEIKPGSHRTFEMVRHEIKQAEIRRIRSQIQQQFQETITKKHPVTWRQASPPITP